MSSTTDITELPEGAAAAVREIRDLAQAAVQQEPVDLIDGVKSHLVAPGFTQVITDAREDPRAADAPDRRRGVARLQELEPFVRYTNLHASADATTVWTQHDPGNLGRSPQPIGSITAILDDHSPAAGDREGRAGWGEHRAELEIITTPEWRHWLAGNNQNFDQIELAEHLEDGITEIVKPSAGELLDIVQQIQVTRNSEFKSGSRLADGRVQLQYIEEQDAKAGARGSLEIPEEFILRIAAFPGGDRVEMKARLRWRLRGSDLTIGYKLERPGDVLAEAVSGLHGQLLDQLDESIRGRVFRGSPIASDRARTNPVHEVRITRVDRY